MEKVRAVVCSGGGAIGLWQWEVLKELKKRGIKFDIITGTSAGALNAFGFSKNFSHPYIDDVYREAFFNNASPITKPYLAKLENGSIEIEGGALSKVLGFDQVGLFGKAKLLFSSARKKLAKLIFANVKTITHIMDNTPLIETVMKLDAIKEGVSIECFINYVSMRTGELVEVNYNDFDDPYERAKGIVSSTNIPFVWEPIDFVKTKDKTYYNLIDSGIRAGIPLSGIIDRFDKENELEVYVLSCGRKDMVEQSDFSTFEKIMSRCMSIIFNETHQNDLARTLDRNQLAKENPSWGLKHIDLKYIEYSGNRDTFEFTPESYADQILTAQKDVNDFFKGA